MEIFVYNIFIIFTFKHMPYLISVFFFNLPVFSSGITADGISSSCTSQMFCKCKRWRWSQSLSFHSIHHFTSAIQWFANFRGLKPTHFFIFAVILLFQTCHTDRTLEGFSIAHVEKHRCLLCKSLIMFKDILPTQSIQVVYE